MMTTPIASETLLNARRITCPNCGHHLSPGSIETSPTPATVPNVIYINDAVSQLEASVIQAKPGMADTNLGQLDDIIKRLFALLAPLTKWREQIRQYSTLHQGALSVFRRFPHEILALIFQEVGLPAFRSAYPLSQVCRFWRNVAFSTPSLWTNSFALELQEGKERQELQWTQRWLSNSGGLPISFTLRNHYSNNMVSSHPCIKLLAAHAHRWMNADICLPLDKLGDILSTLNNLPLLETLSIGTRYKETTPLPDGIANAFVSAPRLHSLVLGLRISDCVVKVPWNQLTSCKLVDRYTIAECYELFQNCHNMTHCELGIVEFPSPETDITQRPVLVHPKIMDLQIHEGVNLGRLLDRLELPAMTNFGHSDCNLLEELFIYDRVVSLFARSMPPLHSLDLDHSDDTTHLFLIDCLELFPLLEVLSLTYHSASGVNAEFLHRLTHDPGQTGCCLVPKLQDFTVQIEEQFNFEAFTKMIESRWRHHDRDCRAPDHRPIIRMTNASLRTSYGWPEVQAEDTVLDADEEKPAWLGLLQQFRSEGFSLETTESDGCSLSLENLVYGIAEPDSDY